MSDLTQLAPDNRDTDGRTSAAQFIKSLHAKGVRGNLLKDHFRPTGHDRPGDTLRKDTTFSALHKIHRGEGTRLEKAVKELAALGVRIRGVELGHPVTHAGSQRTVKAMKKALQHRHPYTPEFLTKLLPPQDTQEPDGELVDTGAVNDWSTQGQTASAVRADLLVGREHTAEQHNMGRGRTAVNVGDAASASGSGGRERKVRTTPTPTPDVSAAGRAKDPNRDDTLEAIKAVHAGGPRPMWG